MAGESWIYQGRQHHMWFGHGTKPKDGSDGTPGTLDARIRLLAATAIAGLPNRYRHHAAALFKPGDADRLVQAMRAWVGGLNLRRDRFAAVLFDRSPDDAAVTNLRHAAEIVATASTSAEMRDATDALARGMVAVGLDWWRRFLADAGDRAQESGLGLAPPVTAQATQPAQAGANAQPDDRAKRWALIYKLVVPGAQATEADLDVVRRDMMAHAPYDALWFLDHYGITVVVTRGAVTTEWPRLRDGLPRGYIAQSMDSVTGIYDAARRRAIIATQDDGKGNRRMPDAREEGSVDAALHEGGHGVNSRSTWFGLMSDKDDYKAVYEQDGRKGVFADRYFH